MEIKNYGDFKPQIPDMLKGENGKQQKVRNIDLSVRSEEVQEIIGRPPHWLVRGGIGALFGVLALIFIAASFVKYPEVIKSQLTLTAINAPKTVESKLNGKIVKLFMENGSNVNKGKIVGWMESTGSHSSVELLSDQIDSLEKWIVNEEFSKIKSTQISDIQQLGELQSTVQAFNQVFREYILYLPGGYFDQRKEILEQEQQYINDLLTRLELQQEIQESNFRLAEQEFEAKKKLAEKGLIARLEFLNAESEFSNMKMPLQQTESAIINNKVSQISKQKELLELIRQEDEIKSRIKQSLNSLKSSINDWEYQYLLKAPVSGSLVYSGVVQEQQTLQAGQTVFFIEPFNTDFFGEMKISQASFGKIEVGQQVLVRFSGYPYHEFGSVMGEIEYISEFPIGEGELFAKVRFPEGLKTNYGNKLTPADGMEGDAEIITQDMRLLKRVYNNLTKELVN